MTKFDELRNKYHQFYFDDYHIENNNGNIKIDYFFHITDLDNFVTSWTFKASKEIDSIIFDKLVFSLGLIEAISYYKITCCKDFVIACGKINDKQCLFLKKLIYNGLGEFMFKNNIDVSIDELVNIIYQKDETNKLHDISSYEGILVPVGGGKDSCVSLELLKDNNISTYCINANETIKNVINESGINNNYYVTRTLDKKMLDYNAKGFLNGHTPFSAIVAFSTFICAYLNGIKYIALSNESSANESTVSGSFVNHQYSKSYEFENDFNEYMHNLVDSDIHYFSFLRPLSELQIAYLFAKNNKYYNVFRSCNVGSKKGIWCGNCPKCLFVYIILSPFIKEDKLINIFGKKILDNQELENDFRGLVGIDKNKPFECVGTRNEVVAALTTYIKNNSSYLTDKYKDFILNNQVNIEPILKSFNEENNVPKELVSIIKDVL